MRAAGKLDVSNFSLMSDHCTAPVYHLSFPNMDLRTRTLITGARDTRHEGSRTGVLGGTFSFSMCLFAKLSQHIKV